MADQTDLKIKLSAIDQLTPAMTKAVEAIEKIESKLGEMQSANLKTQQSTEGLHGGVVSLAAGLEIAHVAVEGLKVAWELLEAPMEKAIEEALAAEKAQNLLIGALVSTGKYTHALAEEMSEYAETTEKASGANAEAVKTHIALGLQMGLSVQKSKEMEEASRKLALLMGGDQERAFQTLQQSLTGHARGLALVLPQVKEFGQAQLKQGEAIAVVNKALEAQYQAYQSSLPAAIERAKTSYTDLYKSIGLTVTTSPAVRGAIDGISSVLRDLSKFIEENKKGISEWVSTGVMVAISSLGALNSVFDIVGRGGKIAFDGISVALESVALGIVTVVGGPIDLLFKALSKLPGMGDTFANMSKFIEDTAADLSASVHKNFTDIVKDANEQTVASKAIEAALLKVTDAAALAEASQGELNKSMEEGRVQATNLAGALLNATKMYGEYEVGTQKQREALAAQKEDRDKDFQDFQKYYGDKIALAISRETEQQANVADFFAKELDTYGARRDALIAGEQLKEEKLKAVYEQGKLDWAQYQTDLDEMSSAFDQRRRDMEDKDTSDRAGREEVSGSTIKATRDKYIRDNEKGQALALKNAASGARAMEVTQKALGDTFNKLGSAMIHSQKITASQMTGVFLESFGTQVQQKGFGDIAMGIFPPNAGLLAAGAGEVAVGTVIGRIGAGMQTSQAHGGMDEIPSSLDNKSFLLAGGERIVQPEANRDLKNFLDDQKNAKSQQSAPSDKPSINATIHLTVNGKASKEDMATAARDLAAELRRMSERGEQIISVKGVY